MLFKSHQILLWWSPVISFCISKFSFRQLHWVWSLFPLVSCSSIHYVSKSFLAFTFTFDNFEEYWLAILLNMPQFEFVSCFLINRGYTFLTRVDRISIVFSLYHIFMFTMCTLSCFSWTLYDPMDCGPPGSSLCGILQARILKWVAMPSSRGSFRPRDWTCMYYVSFISRWVLYC